MLFLEPLFPRRHSLVFQTSTRQQRNSTTITSFVGKSDKAIFEAPHYGWFHFTSKPCILLSSPACVFLDLCAPVFGRMDVQLQRQGAPQLRSAMPAGIRVGFAVSIWAITVQQVGLQALLWTTIDADPAAPGCAPSCPRALLHVRSSSKPSRPRGEQEHAHFWATCNQMLPSASTTLLPYLLRQIWLHQTERAREKTSSSLPRGRHQLEACCY